MVKLPVETCVQHDSCDRCLAARNPYCGWCSLQKRCTVKSECNVQTSSPSSSLGPPTSTSGGPPASSHLYRHHHHNLPHHHHNSHHRVSHHQHNSNFGGSQSNLFSTPRWLSLETSQCIDFQAIKPEFLPRDVVAPVSNFFKIFF